MSMSTALSALVGTLPEELSWLYFVFSYLFIFELIAILGTSFLFVFINIFKGASKW